MVANPQVNSAEEAFLEADFPMEAGHASEAPLPAVEAEDDTTF